MLKGYIGRCSDPIFLLVLRLWLRHQVLQGKSSMQESSAGPPKLTRILRPFLIPQRPPWEGPFVSV